MFRRREDSLFDNTTDPNQEDDVVESAKIVSAPSSSSGASSTPSANTAATTTSVPASSTAPTSTPSYGSAPVPPAPSRNTPSATGFRPAPSTPGTADLSRNRPVESKPMNSTTTTPSSKSGHRVLTVGSDILLKGEIATCDRLVIEGQVDATLNDVHTVEIAECGSFKGSARIEDAEISGVFDGDLVVTGRLVIYATGKVRGKITYGEIEIERGGELTGEINTTDTAKNGNGSRTTNNANRQPAKQGDKVAA